MLRPQTWYLLLAAVVALVSLIAAPGSLLQAVLLAVAAVAAVAAVPLYKNRRAQAALCLLTMALVLAWYVLLALKADGSTLSLWQALPAVTVVLVFMARKGIVHDEKVVRSYERIR